MGGRNVASVASFLDLQPDVRKLFCYKAILKNPENICWTKKTGFSIMKTSEVLCG